MKFLCLLLAIASFCAVNGQYGNTPYGDLDLLPGLDFVGFGYDARFDTASAALQIPIVDYSFVKAKRYSYPTFRDGVFRVPDQIYVRNIAFTEADAYLYDSLEEYKTKAALDVGIDFESLNGTGQVKMNCSTTSAPAGNETQSMTNCTTLSAQSSAKIFSIGSTVNYLHETFSSNEVYVIENSEKTQLYHIFLDSQYYRQEVRDAMQNLTLYRFEDNPQLFFRFIEQYGTHYVTAATIGGMVTMTTTTSQTLSTTSSTAGASLSVGHQKISSQDALNSASASFSSALTANLDFSYQTVDKSIAYESSSNWRLIGGDTTLVNLLDTKNSSLAISEWKQTITGNAVPVAYRLREISTLFSDPNFRDELSNAVKVYLNFDTSGIVEVSNFDGTEVPIYNEDSK